MDQLHLSVGALCQKPVLGGRGRGMLFGSLFPCAYRQSNVRFNGVLQAMPEPTLRRNVSFYHPDVDAEYAAGNSVSATHPSIHVFLAPELPTTHPDVDVLLRFPRQNPLPDWHPNLSKFQRRLPEPTRRRDVTFCKDQSPRLSAMCTPVLRLTSCYLSPGRSHAA